MANHNKVKEFYLNDYEGTLFPMETCRFMIENSSKELSEFIAEVDNFLPQETVYSSKSKQHLRRTKKLDPVAEYYLYEMAYINRKVFKKSANTKRKNYGYRFSEGEPLSIHSSYQEFNTDANKLKNKYKHFIKFDISAYFNSIYHHDLTNWFASQDTNSEDVDKFGKFMREINSGFSIDFLPHGLYPTKMLGSHFLSFIDNSSLIKCNRMIRFMDDFIIFSDSKDILIKDFETIQKILGQKSLNLNPSKTVLFPENEVSITDEIDEVVSNIIDPIYIGSGSGIDYESSEEYEDIVRKLNEEQIKHLIGLADKNNISDIEAELVLDCIEEHTSDFLKYVVDFYTRFPHLVKKIYYKCESVNAEELSQSVLLLLVGSFPLNEYQLFWLAKIVETYLMRTKVAGRILSGLYEHKNATNITKAKILEIPEQRFGMPEWREVHLKNGSSGWLAWSSAIGSRKTSPIYKNYLMNYFSKASPMNKLISDCVKN